MAKYFTMTSGLSGSGLHINKPPTHRSQLRPKNNKNKLKYSVCCQIRFKNLKNRPCGAQGHDAHSIHTIFGKIPTRKGHEIELSRRKSTPKHEFPHFFSSFFEEKKKGQKSHSQYTISRFRDTHSRRRKKSEHYKGTWAGLLTKHRGRCGLQRTLVLLQASFGSAVIQALVPGEDEVVDLRLWEGRPA